MIDEAIYLQYPASQIPSISENPFLQLIHINLHDQTISRIVPCAPFPLFLAKGETGGERAVLESFPVTEKPWLVLASNSPRRRELLKLTGWTFTVSAANVDESERPNESPAEYVVRLAQEKARAVQADADQLVLAADTTVVDRTDILGKPRDPAEAIAMLRRLRGHTHQVYTGIALFRPADGLLLKDLCVTDVPMREYSDKEIAAYVETGDPLDKAGAYAIQHPQFQPVAELRGCFASVMGLPVCHVIRLMRQLDIQPVTELFLPCETLLEYQCPVSNAILSGDH